jgi:transposase-like protein
MATKGPLSSEERLQIIEMLKRGNLSHRAISRQFNRSQSTISSIAKDAGIRPSHRRKRTPAATDVESTYDRQQRIGFVDRFIGVLAGMVSDGGLSPREAREVAQAAKVALDARRSEDVEPDTTNEPDEGGYVPIGLGEMRVHPNTYIGHELLKVAEQLQQESGHPGEEYGAGDKSANGGF